MEHKLQERPKLTSEPLPSVTASVTSLISHENSLHIDNEEGYTTEEFNEKIETLLLERIRGGDKLAIFQLGQYFFEQENYSASLKQFDRIKDEDFQALYQLGVMYYDGLGTTENYKLGVEYMKNIATSQSKRAKHLRHAAQYNVGRACMEGFGVKQSYEEAEKWWLLAADDGNPQASIKAQTSLGMFYSRDETKDLKKAFFWHSEATGNGSLESQGALGVMYETGQGCIQDSDSAFQCLKEASERGNVYAMGNLVSHYYRRKLYTKAAETAARVSLLNDVAKIAKETDCLPIFIAKGIALGCFFYARCLHQGLGVVKNKVEAQKFYSKAYEFDPATTQWLQNLVTLGKI
ncbi:LRP2-binding protein-like [Saccoglossus kowalevskii]|uniref:LRP2-binding protein n=1 Tax=Saccoglossus kowalevskii TaxID=10224 RepID=A0ABM0M8S3_SACKO|nr:PREDICTED: LRP2-binding protein-like isoform X1 [Saccoglossus kowalevskii]XP_006816414.1 PREDICTED: LRP2-binding protein-like isoform X2 [Saccoglossus kowalevskii]